MSSKVNPCFCWSLKDGCVTIGVWSLIWSIVQLGVYSWQTAAVKALRDRMDNRRIPVYQSYSVHYNRLGGGGWNHNDVTPEEKIYTGLFVIQILNLIAAFALLCASASLIFGVHTNTRSLIWPWFPSSGASILCSFIYCILWWVGNVSGYQTTLTIVEFFVAIFNIYCMICIYVHYGRVRTDDGINGRLSVKGKNLPVYEHNISREQNEPYSKRRFVGSIEKLAYDNRVFEDETPSPQTKVNLCQIAESQKSISLTKTDRAEDEIFLTSNEDRRQKKEQENSNKDGKLYAMDEQAPENKPILKDSFKDVFLKEVVAASEQIPSEQRLPSTRLRDHQKDSSTGSFKDREPENSHRRHKRRSSRSRDRKSTVGDDQGRHHHHRHRHGRRGHDASSDDDHDDYDHGHGTTARRSSGGRSRSRSRSSCGHYERKKSRERSVSRGTQAAAATSGASGGADGIVDDTSKSKDGRHSCQKRSVRNVKREAQTRQSSAETGAIFPNQVTSGGISIPQNIVIPAQPGRTTPQRYQISSEVTISYNSSDKSAETSRANSRQAPQVHPPLRPTTSNDTNESRTAIV